MADNYKYLTEAEKAYWDIYTRLRELSDWEGFSDRQKSIKEVSRAWLQNKRKEIWRCAEGTVECEGGAGWSKNNRQQRYEQLTDENLNAGSCQRLTQLPTNGNTAQEKAQLSEREMWWQVASVDEQTKQWRQENADYCTSTRKRIYSLAEQTTWDAADRKVRWNNFCVATKTGAPYKSWQNTHNDHTGAPNAPAGGSSPPAQDTSSRGKAVARARSFIGTHEVPAGSNKGSPQPSGWQKRVIGSDGYAWCACFVTCMAWDAGVKGASSAGVIVCKDLAQKGIGMYRGYTTDPSKVLRGDFAIIGCSTCHIELVIDSNDPYHTIGGNTSTGRAGSQYNGGGVYERHRSKSEVIGWCLVDYPN